MRRARYKLQVSTFPFLAVLLAAMGALILLLLVMDRRAKIVARNKALEAVAQRRAAKAEEDKRRGQAWERDQAERDTLVRNEIHQVAAAHQEAENRLLDLKTRQEAAAAQVLALNKELAAEKSRLEKALAALALPAKSKVERAIPDHEAERRKLGQRLVELELALEALKSRKGQEQNTYSLVAYGGKRGQDRRPIYVECLSHAVVWHPGGERMSRAECSGDRFRAEVERRGASLVKAKPADPRQPPPSPSPIYVLFLVRPDGIETYYEACNALKGYMIDFGYEFIDAGWVLDFPGEKRMAALGGKYTPSSQYPELGAPNAGVGADRGQKAGSDGNPLRTPNAVGVADRGHGSGGPGKGGLGPQYPVLSFPNGAGIVNRGQEPAGDGKAVSNLQDPVLGSPKGAGVPEVGQAPGGGGRKVVSTQHPIPSRPNAMAGADQGSMGKDKGSQDAKSNPAELEWRKMPGPPGGSDSAGSQNEKSTGPADPFQRSVLGGNKGTGQAGTPPPLSRVVGNRDFVVTLDCFDDRVAVSPGGQIMPLAGLDARAQAAHIARVVQQLINRRQATVRPGEQPYRPSLRLQVYPDGLRTYFRLVGALEGLGYPMARENVEE